MNFFLKEFFHHETRANRKIKLTYFVCSLLDCEIPLLFGPESRSSLAFMNVFLVHMAATMDYFGKKSHQDFQEAQNYWRLRQFDRVSCLAKNTPH